MEVGVFEGRIYFADDRMGTPYVLTQEKEFFKVAWQEAKKIPIIKKLVPPTPIKRHEIIDIKNGQRISFESLKKTRGKNRWARNIKLLGLGELQSDFN